MMTAEAQKLKAPIVDTNTIEEVASGIWVIPDANYIPFVPNIGIIVGTRATFIVDTGFGSENARAVLKRARQLSGQRPIYLTHTHCHPEHGFGANAIAGDVMILYNNVQWDELQEKGATILRMFRDMMPSLAPMLDDVEFVHPDILYTGSLNLDLGGGLVIELREFGGAHSRGDQGILVHGTKRVLFVGDLIEEGHFGVIADNESGVIPWIGRLNEFEALRPDFVVPGHGHTSDISLITDYRGHFEFAKRRVAEFRAEGKPSEGQIAERVSGELIERYPDWQGRDWARRIVENLTWPSRVGPRTVSIDEVQPT